ncbi:MAG: hypothetical protein OEY94_01145 [Alphaproteobacteria bacterium]|nr:hypothetical protein [Alphaproteobacteria bacterium]
MRDKTSKKPESPNIYVMGLTVRGDTEERSYEFCSAHEGMFSALKNFIYDLHQNDILLPKDIFLSILDDMECFVFDPETQDKKELKFEIISKGTEKRHISIEESIERLSEELAKSERKLSKETVDSLEEYLTHNLKDEFKASTIEEARGKATKPEEEEKPKKQEKAALEIGKHIKGKDAHKLLKRAMMHYWKDVGSSLKAGTYEFASNLPTFYLAATEPNGQIMTSAAGGGALTLSFMGEAGMDFYRFLRCARLEMKLQDNTEEMGQEKALKTLENDMHKEGLLFENIPEYNLDDFPKKRFNQIIESIRIFQKQGHFKKRVEDVGNYLRNFSKKDARKIAENCVSAAHILAFGTANAAGKIIGDSITNWAKPSYWKNIAVGAFRIPQSLYTYKLGKNELRHVNKQKPHFTEITKGKHRDSLIAKSDPEFTEELRKSRRSVKQEISNSKYDTFRYGLETAFIGGHIVEVSHDFNPDELSRAGEALMNMDFAAIEGGEVFTSNNIKLLVSLGSISLALEPWSHLGKNLDTVYKKITGARSKQTTQYDRYLKLMDSIEEKQNNPKASSVEPSL